MSDKPYKAGYRHEPELHCVYGPGNGMGYYSHTLWPHLSMTTMEEAERAADIANIAYAEGYKQAQADIRKSIGA